MGRDIEPLSYLWGFDRGLPLNRYYIERFLEEFRGDIRGHCLEFQDSPYTRRYGGDAVTKLDILHIDDSQPQATIVADLTKPNDIPTGTFDCIICTQVLHVIFEVDKAVSELHRILKPGGVLLATVPHISMCDPGWHEIWRFTPEGPWRRRRPRLRPRGPDGSRVRQLADRSRRASWSRDRRVQQGDAGASRSTLCDLRLRARGETTGATRRFAGTMSA